MAHSIQEFFLERGRSRRRVSALSLGVATFLLSLLGFSQVPPVKRMLSEIPIMRFGFEGPTRYVRLIQVEALPGEDEPLMDLGRVMPQPARRGGAGEPTASRSQRSAPKKRTEFLGPGDARRDLMARALESQGRIPIFQSDELIIDYLVKPIYPEDARARGAEGKVAVLALVDTLGGVIEAQVIGMSGEPQLDRAAEDAVRKCRFRPYRLGGEPHPVYAVFRFAFRIY